ncbi:MAG: hypothetical protein HQK50_18175 [Oligoflexia bacterium]|nr:hypothetical protein [Oligoflexia bacterium]
MKSSLPLVTTVQFGGWRDFEPTAISNFNCLAVVASYDSNPNSSSCIDTSGNVHAYPMQVVGSVPTSTGSVLEMTIPRGDARTFSIIGFASASGACPSVGAISSSELADLSAPYILGETTININQSEMDVPITISLTGAKKLVRCQGSLFSWSTSNNISVSSMAITNSGVSVYGANLDKVKMGKITVGSDSYDLGVSTKSNSIVSLVALANIVLDKAKISSLILDTALGAESFTISFTGLGSAATLNVGTLANNIVQLDANAKLPAVDGSALTNTDRGDFCCRLSANANSFVDDGGGSTLYLLPYKSNKIALYNGTSWITYTLATSLSITNTETTSDKNYDVFAYYDSGSSDVKLELVQWTNNLTRAVTLTRIEGIYVKQGETYKRYLGTVGTDNSNNFHDANATRFVWNYYNRLPRKLKYQDTNATCYPFPSSGAGTWVSLITTLNPMVDIVTGVAEGVLDLVAHAYIKNTAAASAAAVVGIALDGSTSNDADYYTFFNGGAANAQGSSQAYLKTIPTIGRHRYSMIEAFYGGASGNHLSICGQYSSIYVTGFFGTIDG